MKKKSTISVLLLSALLSFAATAAETRGVVVTIKPLHSLVAGVIGDTGEAELLVTGNASPHDFQFRPSKMRIMQEANVIFYIDDSFEIFLDRVFAILPAHVRRSGIVQKAGLTMLSQRTGGVWDAHQHEEHEAEEHETEEHETEEAHHDDEHEEQARGQYNMHVWLDPENAKRIIKSISRELSIVYPENRDIYQENAHLLIEKTDALDAELKLTLSGLQDEPFIVFHDAYQYFERAYGLGGAGSITFEPDESPSPSRVREVREKLQQSDAKCIFREPQFSDRLIKTVTEGTNAKSGILDPLGAELTDGETLYFNMMRNLADNLKRCLSQ